MEIKLENVKEKLANARKLCPGMSEEVYALTDYMSEVANDTLVPHGMVLCLTCILSDVERGSCGFAGKKNFPNYLINYKEQVLNQAPYILQVIDVIADEEFADEVRHLCMVFLNFNPPKRVNAEVNGYPEYVKVAIDWWANAILSPRLDNGDALPKIFGITAANTVKKYTEEDIKTFKETLAQEIIKDLRKEHTCILNVDYSPCKFLANAGEKIGVNDMLGWPWKTSMLVSEKQVSVSAGYGAIWRVLWSKPKV